MWGGEEAVRLWFCTPSPQAVNSWPRLHDMAEGILVSGRVIAPTTPSGEIWNLPVPRFKRALLLTWRLTSVWRAGWFVDQISLNKITWGQDFYKCFIGTYPTSPISGSYLYNHWFLTHFNIIAIFSFPPTLLKHLQFLRAIRETSPIYCNEGK